MKCYRCGTEYNGNFCPVCGQNNGFETYGAQQPVTAVKPKKKPFFLRWWFILLAIIVVGIIWLNSFGPEEPTGTKAEQFEWTDIEMHEMLPEPNKSYGSVGTNSKEVLNVTFCDVNEKGYKDYRDQCKNIGYTVDPNERENSYSAYNQEGYSVKVTFLENNGEIIVYLKAPEKMEEFLWPTYGPGAILPATKSTFGRIAFNNSDTFIVHVGNMTVDEYKEYVKLCEDRGFTVDYSKDDEYYSAKNADGYEITLSYLGFNKVEVSVSAPESDGETAYCPEVTEKETENNTTSIGPDPDFKAFMDSYEKYMDEYVAFMKKYNDNPTDLGLLADYSSFMSKYTDFVEKIEKWEDEEMSPAEAAYYAEVQARVSKKLLEITD